MSYSFRGFTIPEYMENGIKRYVEKGIPPGDFLHAVLSNNLCGAVYFADDVNLSNLPAYIGYFYNDVPSICWGSKEKVNSWIGKTREERNEVLAMSEYKSL